MTGTLDMLQLDAGFWYLATPYTKYESGLQIAFFHACDAAGELLKRGVHCYSPIAHTHPVAIYGGLNPLDHETVMALDAHFMDAAAGLLIVKMPGWDESRGIAIEIDVFKAAGKPVQYLDWPVLAVAPNSTGHRDGAAGGGRAGKGTSNRVGAVDDGDAETRP